MPRRLALVVKPNQSTKTSLSRVATLGQRHSRGAEPVFAVRFPRAIRAAPNTAQLAPRAETYFPPLALAGKGTCSGLARYATRSRNSSSLSGVNIPSGIIEL